jgi:hypothetical protein
MARLADAASRKALMKTLCIATFCVVFMIPATVGAQIYTCTQVGGKRVVQDHPCVGSPVPAVPVEKRALAAAVIPPTPQALTAASAPVPRYARDQPRKIEAPLTAEQELAKERYKKAYFAEACAGIKANLVEINSDCRKGNIKACEVVAMWAALPREGCLK